MFTTLIWDDDLHVEATSFEGEGILRVIDAQTATDAFGRFKPQSANHMFLNFEWQVGSNSIARTRDTTLRSILPQLAIILRTASTMQASGVCRHTHLQPLLFLLRETPDAGSETFNPTLTL